MISIDDKKIECSVHIIYTDNPSNIRLFGDRYELMSRNIPGGDNCYLEFRILDKVIATSSLDEYPNIGMDFIWSWVKNPNITSVVVAYNSSGIKVNNGSVVVSPSTNSYTESDLVDAIKYALSLNEVDLNERIKLTLNWLKK
jgi:hypothetical protein